MPLPPLTAEPLLIGASGLLAIASLPRGRQMLRGAMVVVGLAGLVWAIDRHRGMIAGLAFGGLACINLLQIALRLPRRGLVRLSGEEMAMALRFPPLPRHAFRDSPNLAAAARTLVLAGETSPEEAVRVTRAEGVDD